MSFKFPEKHFHGYYSDFEIRDESTLRKKFKLRGLKQFLNEAKIHEFYSGEGVSYVPTFFGVGFGMEFETLY